MGDRNKAHVTCFNLDSVSINCLTTANLKMEKFDSISPLSSSSDNSL